MTTLTTGELDDLLDQNGEDQVVDVHPPSHYDKLHLPNARSIPVEQLRDWASDALDPERPVVVYCSGPDCGMSPKAARILDDLGFKTVYDYEGGIAEWLRGGHEVVKEGEPTRGGQRATACRIARSREASCRQIQELSRTRV